MLSCLCEYSEKKSDYRTAYITSHTVARDVTAVDPITFPTISFRHFIPTALLFKYIHSYSLPILFRSFFFYRRLWQHSTQCKAFDLTKVRHQI